MIKPEIILGYLDKFLKGFIVLTLALMLFVVGLQVFYRFVPNHALPWPEEATRYLMVWSIYVAAFYVHMERGHIRISFFVEKLPPFISKIVTLILDSAIMVFLWVIFIYGLYVAASVLNIKTPALRISKFIPFMSISTSAFLMIIATALHIINDLQCLFSIERKIE